MTIKMRQMIEKKIVRALVKSGIAAGYTVTVNNGEDTPISNSTSCKDIVKEMFATDEEHLIFKKEGHGAAVFLVYGNDGYDVICDYNVSLEHIMEAPNKVSDFYANFV